MEKEVKFIIDTESQSYEIMKNIPAIHRNAFLHLAIVHAVNTDFYKLMAKNDVVVEKVELESPKRESSTTSSTQGASWNDF